ncbi:extensin-like domain-containing protein [Hyphomicrobium sp.]|uniref:extensin-like domain-containing protein n=1 Tax=Hyphomicrobium sp. TaxID=82 RepID=UPI003F6FF351
MRFSRVLALPVLATALLSGCSSGPEFVAKYEPWRAKEENSCLSSGVLARTTFIKSRSALGGPSVCGTERPFELSAVDDGRIRLKPAAMLRCPMIPQVERWIRESVAPAARYYLGSDLVEVSVAASYSCRPMNNVSGAKLSEHGYANALDVSGFTLASGRKVTLSRGWNGAEDEQAFLRAARRGACEQFTTVLSPDHDRAHHDHFHVDLARHGRDGLKGICK